VPTARLATDPQSDASWMGLANAFVVDWLLRLQVDTTLNFLYWYGTPFPALMAARRLAPVVERLHSAGSATARAPLRAEIDALVADLYGLTEEEFALILSTFPLLDRDQPPLPGDCFVGETKRGEKREPRSFITRDKALLALFDLRGREPPTDIVAFFASAGVDISRNTGPIRDLRQRVAEAERRGAVAYIPSVRGRPPEGSLEDWEVR